MQQPSGSPYAPGPSCHREPSLTAPRVPVPGTVVGKRKRPWLCVMLSMLMPGCGLMAAGSLAFGLAYLLLFFVLVVASAVAFIVGMSGMVFYGLDGASRGVSRDVEVLVSMTVMFGSPAVLGLAVTLWIASVIHAGVAASDWNSRHADSVAPHG